MSLRLITGRAGSGKTTHVLREIAGELKKEPLGTPLILLTPEQASFQIEYALAKATGSGGFMRAQVLGFSRLAQWVLQDAGGAVCRPLGEVSRRMILRLLLEKRLPQLQAFSRAARLPGFVDKLEQALSEMKVYRISPEDLADCLNKLEESEDTEQPGALVDKLKDLQLILQDFTDFLQERFIDPEDYLTLAAQKACFSKWLVQARVWIDGFNGFTPQEYEVLEALLKRVQDITITLCLDAGDTARLLTETDPFFPVWETYHACLHMAEQAGKPINKLFLAQASSPPRFTAADLVFLENNYFSKASPEPVWRKSDATPGGVKLAAAVDIRAEIEGMARAIIGLCRDQNYRWRDIVVLLRDLESYGDLIKVIFADQKIPFFLDVKRSILHHPLVELIRAALETVTQHWSFEPVFRYLKTDLVPVSRTEIDLLENYVLAYGIRGSRWYNPQSWTYYRRFTLEIETDEALVETERAALEKINNIRNRAIEALAGFYQVVLNCETVADYTRAVYKLLEELKIQEQLVHWTTKAREQGQLEEAGEHEQIWKKLITLLDEMLQALGEEKLPLDQYLLILDAGLSALRLGLIPPGLDQVLIGSLERSRSPQVKAAFLPGINEGVLPARLTEEGLFTEAERDRLQSSGLQLAPNLRQRVFNEQFLVYQALTRSSAQLTVSYLLADGEGRALRPSPVIHRLREMFPQLAAGMWQQEPGAENADDLDFITHPRRSLTYLAGRLRDLRAGRPMGQLWWDVYNWFVKNYHSSERQEEPLMGSVFAKVMASLFYRNREEPLPRPLSRRLYGQPFRTGVSGLEQYYSCPFAHFLAKGLRLKERTVFKLQAPDFGEFFHAALNMFASRLQEENLDWGGLGTTGCRRLAGEVVDTLAPRLQNEILLSSARHRYLTLRLKRIVQRAAQVLGEHARRGKFRPMGLELAFGPGGTLPAATFMLPEGGEMLLTGRIDRLDAGLKDNTLYLRIIDYKSGTADVKLDDIWHGLKLQLLTYLEIALAYSEKLLGAEALPGAVLYFRIAEPLLQTQGTPLSQEEAEELLLKELSMKGLLLRDKEMVELMDTSLGCAPDILPVSLKKDGDFTARSAVLDLEQFNLLRFYLRQKLISAGAEILDGFKEISPYRQGEFRYCRFCSYKPVCKFDLLTDNGYRLIRPEKDYVVWQRIEEQLRLAGE